MKVFLLAVFACYLSADFFGSFAAWLKAKNNKEYWWRCVDTVISGVLIVGFIKLIEEVAL